MAVQNLGFTPLALRRNADEEFRRILASGAQGGGPRIIGASGGGGGGGNGLAQDLSSIGSMLSNFAEQRKAAEKEAAAQAEKQAMGDALTRANMAYTFGVKEWRNPDTEKVDPETGQRIQGTGDVMVPGMAPGVDAMMYEAGKNPSLAPTVMKARLEMAKDQKAPPMSQEAMLAFAERVNPSRSDTVLWAAVEQNLPAIFGKRANEYYAAPPKVDKQTLDLYHPETGTKQTVLVGSPTHSLLESQGWQMVKAGGADEPYSPLGKARADLLAGRITEEDFRRIQASVGRGGVNVNVGGADDPLLKMDVATLEDARDAAQQARSMTVPFQRLEKALEEFETGPTASARLFLARLGNDVFGLDIDPTAGEGEVIGAIQSYLTPRMRVPGSGDTSDMEMRTFQESMVNLARSPGGNRKVMTYLKRINDWKIDHYNRMRKYFRSNGSLDGWEDQANADDSRIFSDKELNEMRMVSTSARPAASSNGGPGPSSAGVSEDAVPEWRAGANNGLGGFFLNDAEVMPDPATGKWTPLQ